jgi:aryl-alcohol dehydrogenase-like predicted oxidoreductase
VGLISRVPHASEALTGRYTQVPTFDESDHRSHRRAEWLGEALRKVDRVKFLAGDDVGRTLSQAAIQFALYQPAIVSVLPNFTTLDELNHYTAAVETPPLTDQEQSLLDDLWVSGFELGEEAATPFREV